MPKPRPAFIAHWPGWSNIFTPAGWTKIYCYWSSCAPRRSTAAPFASTCTGRNCARWARREQRLYGLDAWRESPYYSERERAALAWTEAVTLVAATHVPDSVYEAVRPYFSFTELSNLTLAIAAINAWNRLAIATRAEPGKYHVGQFQEQRRAS